MNCFECNISLCESYEKIRYVDEKPHCKKCFYKKLGNLIEAHPIGLPFDYKLVTHDYK